MKTQEDKLIDKYGRKGGWTVPDGYFENVYQEISAKLSERTEIRRHVEMTRWQRIKPYVYLAAMFAGIWLMMQIFHHAAGDMTLNLDNPPEQIAMAMSDSDINESYLYIPESLSDMELENDISNHYSSIEEFEADFGYDIQPQYASMTIENN